MGDVDAAATGMACRLVEKLSFVTDCRQSWEELKLDLRFTCCEKDCNFRGKKDLRVGGGQQIQGIRRI